MLKQRILTAIVLILLVIFAIFKSSPLIFGLLVALLMGLSAWEWTRLIPISSYINQAIYILVILFGIFYANLMPVGLVLFLGFITVCWSAAAVYCYQNEKSPAGFQFASVRALLGFLLLVPCWEGLVFLQTGTSLGPGLLLFSLIVIWATDTGAYFAGRLFGKKLLASLVSPKKTWEGVWGGLLVAFIVAIIGSLFFHLNLSSRILLWLLAVITAVFSIFGDLSESVLKRMAGIKDTSHILPGHGGLLDRIDSVIAGVIVFALGIILLGLGT